MTKQSFITFKKNQSFDIFMYKRSRGDKAEIYLYYRVTNFAVIISFSADFHVTLPAAS